MRSSSSQPGDRPGRYPDASHSTGRDVDGVPTEAEAARTTMTLDRGRTGSSATSVRGGSRAERPPLSEVDRTLATTAVGVSVLALAVLGGVPVPGVVSGLLLLAFWLAGPGAAVVVHLRLRGSTKVAQAPPLGLAVLVGSSLLSVWTGVWPPRLTTAAVAVLTLGVAALALLRRPLGGRPAPRSSPASSVVLSLVLVGALVLWVAALPGIRAADPSIFGLFASGPVLLPVAIAVVLAVGMLALRWRRPVVAGASVAALLVVLRGTVSAGVEEAGPTWAYKHIGVVVQLLEQHEVSPGTDIYMNWPGMFSAAAWFSDVSGVAPLDLARWITPVVHLLLALQVVALARVLSATATGAAGAALLVVALNWVGQDYFAPQALALCLAGGVLVTLVQSRTSRACAVLSLLGFAAIVPTHQLTPFWLLGVAIVLAVLRRAPWWLTLAMVAVVVAFVVPRLDVVASYGIFSGFDPVGNATNNVPGVSAQGSDIGSLVARATVVVMWLSTAAVLVARLHRRGWRRPWRHTEVVVPAVLAFSPIALLGGQSYGGEAINRVILYSCLGCAVVLGPALASALQRRLLPALAAVVWTVVAVGLAVHASFTQWPMSDVRDEDVAAARWLAEEAPDATVIPVVFTWPGRVWLDYERYSVREPEKDASLDGLLTVQAGEAAPPNGADISVGRLEEIVWQRPEDPAYVVFTGSMRARDAYYATYAPGAYQQLLDGLRSDPDWEPVRHEGDLWVFQFVAPGFPVG
jgi:hypothetical protein